VELIEAGELDSVETRELLKKYLLPMVEAGIDQLVLGCTHYPFLIPMIREIVPEGIRIIDPAPAVARQARKILEQENGLNAGSDKPSYRFFTTGDPASLDRVLPRLTGQSYPVNQLV
jgi:glutamate racemase